LGESPHRLGRKTKRLTIQKLFLIDFIIWFWFGTARTTFGFDLSGVLVHTSQLSWRRDSSPSFESMASSPPKRSKSPPPALESVTTSRPTFVFSSKHLQPHSPLCSLPSEIIQNILLLLVQEVVKDNHCCSNPTSAPKRNLASQALLDVGQTCLMLYHHANNDSLWRAVYISSKFELTPCVRYLLANPEEEGSSTTTSWKQIYVQQEANLRRWKRLFEKTSTTTSVSSNSSSTSPTSPRVPKPSSTSTGAEFKRFQKNRASHQVRLSHAAGVWSILLDPLRNALISYSRDDVIKVFKQNDLKV